MRAFLYTWSSCSFCKQAKELLDRHGIPWQEKVLDGDRALFERLARTFGERTMPLVMIDGEPIGGLTALQRRLAPLAAPNQPIP